MKDGAIITLLLLALDRSSLGSEHLLARILCRGEAWASLQRLIADHVSRY